MAISGDMVDVQKYIAEEQRRVMDMLRQQEQQRAFNMQMQAQAQMGYDPYNQMVQHEGVPKFIKRVNVTAGSGTTTAMKVEAQSAQPKPSKVYARRKLLLCEVKHAV